MGLSAGFPVALERHGLLWRTRRNRARLRGPSILRAAKHRSCYTGLSTVARVTPACCARLRCRCQPRSGCAFPSRDKLVEVHIGHHTGHHNHRYRWPLASACLESSLSSCVLLAKAVPDGLVAARAGGRQDRMEFSLSELCKREQDTTCRNVRKVCLVTNGQSALDFFRWNKVHRQQKFDKFKKR